MPAETSPEQRGLNSFNINTKKDTNVLLIEPPNRFPPEAGRRPNGALGPVYLAGGLRNAGYSVDYLDAAVGGKQYTLEDVYLRENRPDEKGLVHIGMSDEEIAEAVQGYNIIGISNIFTLQTNSALRVAHIARQVNPGALLIAGGVNAWSMPEKFLDEFDAICAGEGEQVILDLASSQAMHEKWQNVQGLIHRVDGKTRRSGMPRTTINLDELPVPAYDLWPLEKYWQASAPHGGDFPPGMMVRYASMQTSRGCPFDCTFCHVSWEKDNPELVGPIGKLRFKSIDRVIYEAQILKDLGVEWLFLEDDSLLSNVPRITEIFGRIKELGLNLADVNGVNLVHLFKRDNGQLIPNEELLNSMIDAGFKQLVLPFESASSRIISKYATNKWNPLTMDVVKLVQTAKRMGLTVPGNFMIGFPDETQEELDSTVRLAEELINAGLDYASFFVVSPYPGSALYETAVREGYLDRDIDPDSLHWGNPVMRNTTIPPEELIRIRREEYQRINNPQFISGKYERNVIPKKK